MTNDATSAPPPSTSTTTPGARYSESLHVLVDEPTRAVVMGLAVIAARQAGPDVRPREGESIRQLLESQLEHVREQAPDLYGRALVAGRMELTARANLVRQRRT